MLNTSTIKFMIKYHLNKNECNNSRHQICHVLTSLEHSVRWGRTVHIRTVSKKTPYIINKVLVSTEPELWSTRNITDIDVQNILKDTNFHAKWGELRRSREIASGINHRLLRSAKFEELVQQIYIKQYIQMVIPYRQPQRLFSDLCNSNEWFHHEKGRPLPMIPHAEQYKKIATIFIFWISFVLSQNHWLW